MLKGRRGLGGLSRTGNWREFGKLQYFSIIAIGSGLRHWSPCPIGSPARGCVRVWWNAVGTIPRGWHSCSPPCLTFALPVQHARICLKLMLTLPKIRWKSYFARVFGMNLKCGGYFYTSSFMHMISRIKELTSAVVKVTTLLNDCWFKLLVRFSPT